MMTRFGLAVALIGAMVTASLHAKDQTSGTSLQTPITGSTSTGEHFAGTFTLQRFAVDDTKKVVAVGVVSGTVTNAAGEVVATGLSTVALPVNVNGGSAQTMALAPAVAASCSILHLDLGPLSLNLLGLQVNLNEVVLDITAVPGAGNLLGNLLCSVTNVLNNPAGLANLLNQILGILQGL